MDLQALNNFIQNKTSQKEALCRIREKNKLCRLCDIKKDYTSQLSVSGCGNYNAEIFLIGEAPGEDEVLQGIPFVGRAGQLLNNAIQEAGLIRKELYIHNILSCRPYKNKFPNGHLGINKCIKWLQLEIAVVKPKIIVAIGKNAYEILTEKRNTKITQERGTTIDWTFENLSLDIILIPTLHPSYCMRRKNMKDEGAYNDLVKDLILAKKIIKEG